MMNPAYIQVIGASDAERLDAFLATAGRLGTAVENVEKDFWVCRGCTSCGPLKSASRVRGENRGRREVCA